MLFYLVWKDEINFTFQNIMKSISATMFLIQTSEWLV